MTSPTHTRLAWAALAWNVVVILWGAFVRATGSGAGCGAHWPQCNGEVVPRSANVETMIEFTHRLTSGVALLVVLALMIVGFRAFPRGHRVRRAGVASFVLILVEAALGAGLVLFEYVAGDTRPMRAVVVGAHLVNTLFLLCALTLTAWWSRGRPGPVRPIPRPVLGVVLLPMVAMLVLGASGAITALGDTLFPVSSLAEGLQQDLSPTAHVLIQLRVFHPLIAVGTGAVVALAALTLPGMTGSAQVQRWGRVLLALFALQLAVGVLNLVLLAPVAMQLVHLLMADAVWIALVILAAEALGSPGGG